MSYYPPETMRALDRQAESFDHAEAMRSMHVELFEDAVKSGSDIQLLWPYSRGERKTYPVSMYLGESPSAAQPSLFKACAEAMNGRDPSEALRQFVAHVAAEYANDSIEMWGVE